jgi:hypothetical protein
LVEVCFVVQKYFEASIVEKLEFPRGLVNLYSDFGLFKSQRSTATIKNSQWVSKDIKDLDFDMQMRKKVAV